MKKILSKILMLAMAVLIVSSVGVFVSADYDVKPTKISRISKKVQNVKVGNEFKLKVKANGDDDYLYWKIVDGKNVVKIADDDRSDDDIELLGVKKGKAKVVCKIRGSKKKVVFEINVKKAPKSKYIKASKAKNIAFSNAGVKASKVSRVSCVRKKDDGRMIYDIEFSAGKYEYDYEIHAKSGKILERDKDFID